MNPRQLISLMSRPSAYPHPVAHVEVRQTHISLVFLGGPFVYKVKKAVDLGFLDFRSLEQRHFFCHEEVRLNRRLAPEIYLGVVPVSNSGVRDASPKEGVVDWAVKMVRLPWRDSFLELLRREELDHDAVTALSTKLVRFHRHARRGEDISAFGRFEVVADTVLENIDQARGFVGSAVSPDRLEDLYRRTETCLADHRRLIESRAARHVPCEGHGDLRLEHVYRLPDRKPPRNLVIIDCIEFSPKLRCLDPVADVAFLVMDLLFHGRPDLAQVLADTYFRAAADEEGRALLPLFVAYRAVVRGKVESMKQVEPEVPQRERAAARKRAAAYWILAREVLQNPAQLLKKRCSTFAVIRDVGKSQSKAVGYVIEPAENTAPPDGVVKATR